MFFKQFDTDLAIRYPDFRLIHYFMHHQCYLSTPVETATYHDCNALRDFSLLIRLYLHCSLHLLNHMTLFNACSILSRDTISAFFYVPHAIELVVSNNAHLLLWHSFIDFIKSNGPINSQSLEIKIRLSDNCGPFLNVHIQYSGIANIWHWSLNKCTNGFGWNYTLKNERK